MAKVNVPIVSMSFGTLSSGSVLTGISAGSANGGYVAASGYLNDLVLRFDLTTAGSIASGLNIEAGSMPPAFMAGQGVLAFDVPSTSGSARTFMLSLDGARHVKSAADGSSGSAGDIGFWFGTGVSGSAAAFQLPKGL